MRLYLIALTMASALVIEATANDATPPCKVIGNASKIEDKSLIAGYIAGYVDGLGLEGSQRDDFIKRIAQICFLNPEMSLKDAFGQAADQ